MQSITPPIDMDEARRARGSKVRMARVPIRRALQRHCEAACTTLRHVQMTASAMGAGNDLNPDQIEAVIAHLKTFWRDTPDHVAVALNRRALKHER